MKKTRKNFNKFKYMPHIIGIVLVISLCLQMQAFHKQMYSKKYHNIIAQLDDQIAEQEAKATKLEEKKDYVNTNEYKAQIAKEKLGLVFPNEIIIYAK